MVANEPPPAKPVPAARPPFNEPARLIQWAYAAYSTVEWSLESLLAEVTDRGLRSRGGPNIPQKVCR